MREKEERLVETSFTALFSIDILLFRCSNKKQPALLWRKLTSNWSKINFSEKRNSILAENWFFRRWMLKKKYEKVCIAKFNKKLKVMMYWFCTPGVYERHNWFLNFRQKLHFLSDSHLCMNNMIWKVRNDVLTALFESAKSCVTNKSWHINWKNLSINIVT